jgi:hypothetical protein
MNRHVLERIKSKLREGKLMLFVGSGVSMHLGLPSWSQLVKKTAKMLEYDPEVFCSLGGPLNLMEYFLLESDQNSARLAKWMRSNWENSEVKSRIESSKIYRRLLQLPIDEIYTTNYDHVLELAWKIVKGKDVNRVVYGKDLLRLKRKCPTVIKFHGDYDFPKTMVLGESNYFDRLDFEHPLDVKLKSDLLTKSVLFIGYSLSDINLRYLTYKVNNFFKDAQQIDKEKRESYIFLSRPNDIDELILGKRGIKVLLSDEHQPQKALEQFLKKISC